MDHVADEVCATFTERPAAAIRVATRFAVVDLPVVLVVPVVLVTPMTREEGARGSQSSRSGRNSGGIACSAAPANSGTAVTQSRSMSLPSQGTSFHGFAVSGLSEDVSSEKVDER